MPDTVYLKHLLHNLPDALPMVGPDAFPFINFVPDQEQLEEGLTAAIVKVFKNVFGWQDAGDLARDVPLLIKPRGNNVIGLEIP
jgi:hypothetical protein